MLPLTRPAADVEPAAVLPPATLLASWLSTAAREDLQPRLLRLADGRLVPLPVARWSAPAGPADEAMLSRARGPVLDVGCGPGRLTAALHVRGTEVLGLELLPEVPVLARRAGAPLLVGDVFGTVPRAGQWQTVLLADGNVGIGGDAARVLRRVRALLAPGGQVLCEVDQHGDGAPRGPVRLEGLGATSGWFPWALVGPQGLATAAGAAGLRVTDSEESGGRHLAALAAV